MASDIEFVRMVVDGVDPDCAVTFKRMFGEFGLYSGGTFFGSVCDDQLFVKPTEGGRAFIGTVVEAPPYPGAKNSFLIDRLQDGEWLSELIRITVAELPAPKPTKPKQPKGRKGG